MDSPWGEVLCSYQVSRCLSMSGRQGLAGVGWRARVGYQGPRCRMPRGRRILGLSLGEEARARGQHPVEDEVAGKQVYSEWNNLILADGVIEAMTAWEDQGLTFLAVLWAVWKELLSRQQREPGSMRFPCTVYRPPRTERFDLHPNRALNF